MVRKATLEIEHEVHRKAKVARNNLNGEKQSSINATKHLPLICKKVMSLPHLTSNNYGLFIAGR